MSVRKFWVCLSLVALAAASAFAASGDEFYDRLFNRGMAQFNEGNYANAYNSLRTAAFGLLLFRLKAIGIWPMPVLPLKSPFCRRRSRRATSRGKGKCFRPTTWPRGF